MPDAISDAAAKAIGRIPSGCAILTAGDAVTGTALLASWMQQCSFDPPAVSVCVKKGRPVEAVIDDTGGFVLNIVGENTGPMFKHFGKGFAPAEPAFEGLSVEADPNGVILADAIAHVSCCVADKFDAGDHWLYVGRVATGRATDAKPYVHLRKSGLDY